MKKKYLMAILLVCSAFWAWRYVEVNAYYNHEYPECREESFSMGDEVTLIADRIDDTTNVEGYSIRVDQFEILTQEEVKQRCPESQKIVWQDDDKFALVSVTLSNTASDGGIMLTDFFLHTQDSLMVMDYDLLSMMNPILAGNYGIILSPEKQCQLVLPFRLIASLFRTTSWNHLDQCVFLLRINELQTVKEIHMMCVGGRTKYQMRHLWVLPTSAKSRNWEPDVLQKPV